MLSFVRASAFAFTVACLALPALATDTYVGDDRYDVAQACGWYAIFQCDRNGNPGGPGYTIYTSDFPNFSPGWHCKVMGPFENRSAAVRAANQNGGYAKSAC